MVSGLVWSGRGFCAIGEYLVFFSFFRVHVGGRPIVSCSLSRWTPRACLYRNDTPYLPE